MEDVRPPRLYIKVMHSGKVATTKYVNDAVILIGVVEHGTGDNGRIGLVIIEHSFLHLISQCPKP